MDGQLAALLKKQLLERQASLIEALATGCAKDFAEYKNLVGEVRGLRTAQGNLEDLLKRMERYDDDS